MSINLMGKRYLFFLISLAVIIPGIIVMFVWGLPLSIDFVGGSYLEAKFTSGNAPEPAQVVAFYQNSLGIDDVTVATGGPDILIIRSQLLDDQTRALILSELSKQYNTEVIANRFESVGPSLGAEVTQRAILAVVVSSVVLIIFMWYSFRGIPHAIRYGFCNVGALVHDILIMLSLAALGGHFWGWQINTLFLTALLTVIAFSAQDTIVVFDRIRENSAIYRNLDYEKLVNHSVVQSLTRSFNTQTMSVEFLLLALALFGGITLREFATLLLVGLFSGSYSSVFIAAPLLIIWEKQEWKNWFRRKPKETQLA